jgi:hypothetical protein
MARCGPAGAYRREVLAARFGDMALPDVLIALAACRRPGDLSSRCGANHVDPPGTSKNWGWKRMAKLNITVNAKVGAKSLGFAFNWEGDADPRALPGTGRIKPDPARVSC